VAAFRRYLHHQLFEGAELDGRLTWMNRVVVTVIVLAVATGALATEPEIRGGWHRSLVIAEACFGAIFLLEYLARIYAAADQPGPGGAARKRLRFIVSPLGLIDLVVVVSTMLPVVTADAAILRMVRLLRVLAVMKFGRFSRAIREVGAAIAERGDDLIVTIALAAVLRCSGRRRCT
jgi:voltage-gated potassium channel